MAVEVITLAEIDLDLEGALAESARLRGNIEELRDAQREAAETTGTNSVEYARLANELRVNQRELRAQDSLIQQSIVADNAKEGSIEGLRAQLAIVSRQWAGLSEEERNNTETGQELARQKLELTERLKEEETATGDARRNVGNYNEAVQEGISSVGQFVPTLGQVSPAIQRFGRVIQVALGPIGLIIAAIGLVVTALRAFFTSSEEGQDRLAEFGAIIQAVIGNIVDILSSFGEALVNAFTRPREAIENLRALIERIGSFFQNTFGNIIGGAIEVFVANFLRSFANLGLAWQRFRGLFVDNAEDIEAAQERILELNERVERGQERVVEGARNLRDGVVNAYNRAREAVSSFVDEQEREIEIARELANRQAALNRIIRENTVQEARDRLELERLRNEIEDRANRTAEDQIQLLHDQNNLLDEILERNLNIAREKLAIQQAQNALSNSTREDLEEEARLQAEIFQIQTQIESQRRESISRRLEAERQLISEVEQSTQRQLDIFNEMLDEQLSSEQQLTEDIVNEQIRRQELIFQEQNAALERLVNAQVLSQENFNDIQLEQQRAMIALQEELIAIQNEQDVERRQIEFEAALAVSEGNFTTEFELMRQQLDMQYQAEIDNANRIGADTANIEQKFAIARQNIALAEFNAKAGLAADLTGAVAQAAGEQSGIGKALAITSTTIATIQSAVNSFNSLSGIPIVGPVLGGIAAAAALVSGYAQVREISSISTDVTSGSGSSPSSGGSAYSGISTPSQTMQQPTTASVGAGLVSRDVQDQSAEAVKKGVSEALQENPLEPTLVVDNVTDGQEVTTNINTTSTI